MLTASVAGDSPHLPERDFRLAWGAKGVCTNLLAREWNEVAPLQVAAQLPLPSSTFSKSFPPEQLPHTAKDSRQERWGRCRLAPSSWIRSDPSIGRN
jgi:hypothetical protein